MKKRLLALLCGLILLCATLPVTAATPPVGGDFAWTDQPMLIEQILQRDGLIDGIWFPWFDGGNVGHSLTGNDLMVRYYGSAWSKVAMDTVGAHKIYHEIYNLKAMGYNLLGYGGSIYDEGVIHDAYGDILGIKQEFLDNARRLLDMCREIGMPVMWTIYFHSSSSPGYHGIDAFNIFSQKLSNPVYADHYAERFARPVCEMLAEYSDVVALVAVADEPENEISDSEEGNRFGTAREYYGVTEENMVYFMSRINEVCQEVIPHIARTVASCDMNKAMYDGFGLDLMGHNHYDNNANIYDTDTYFSDAPVILTEYNIGHDGQFTPEQFAGKLIRYREQMITKGYKGGIQWAWMSNGMHRSTAYYLLDGYANGGPNTDFLETVALLRHYIDDYRAAYRGETVVLDKPVLYCNEGGGYVEWIPSRQAVTMDILRSTDGGKSWTTVLSNVKQADYVSKGKGRYKDTAVANSMYKIVVRDSAGRTAESEPNNVAGVSGKYKKATTTVKLEGATSIGRDYSSVGSYPLYSFHEATNRPRNAQVNLLKNGSFESTDGDAWQADTFLGSAVKVVEDATAPDGKQVLLFNSSGVTAEKWYTFKVAVEPNTDYIFSAWVKGDYLAADNAGHASIGVVDPSTGKFMIYPSYRTRPSRANRQIYPTAWDGEWHLRSVAFNSADLTEVTIALCGDNTKLWVDDIALYQNGEGLKYQGERQQGFVRVNYGAAPLVCKDSVNLLQNSAFTEGDRFWKGGNGWKNGFLSVASGDQSRGKVLRYADGEGNGLYYIHWVDVKKNTDYSFSFDIKVQKNGGGKLMLLYNQMSIPGIVTGFEFDKEIYGDDWGHYYLQFNTRNYTRIGIAVCDLGGEALMDNLRLFRSADGTKDTSGETVGTVAPLPSTTTTAAPTKGTTDAPTMETTVVTTLPSAESGVTSATATLPTQGDGAPDEETDSHPAPTEDNRFLWLYIALGGAVVLIGGGIAAWLIWRKKKTA